MRESYAVSFCARGAARRLGLTAVLAMVCLAGAGGCQTSHGVRLREEPRMPLVEDYGQWLRQANRDPSERTLQLVRRYDLSKKLKRDPQAALKSLQELLATEPSLELTFAVAEISYLRGKKVQVTDPAAALDLYGSSVIHAYNYLFDTRFGPVRNPYDPQFRGACDVYNGALEAALRLVQKQEEFTPGNRYSIELPKQTWDVEVVARGDGWHGGEFERFEFVSDYEVKGLTNHYRTFGLGVPLIAVRKRPENPAPMEEYYPPNLSFPVTAFLRVMPAEADPADGNQRPRRRAQLELYDPLRSTDIVCRRARVPLESDLSTPLAYFLDFPGVQQLKFWGLLRPDETQQLRGLYLGEPYRPGKVPIVMVHGLWSDPTTWFEMFNDLRALPEVRENYQFWFYFYPTGQPFWTSAGQMREDLAKMRRVLDPQRRDPLMDQMVLVGHSMGGLVSKMQVIESNDDFWRIVSDRPFSELKVDDETRQRLEKAFFFRANPSVKRVVTIGTPHRGSKFANDFTQWLGRKLISLPEEMVLTMRDTLLKQNPDIVRDDSLLEIKTSLDSLDPESPALGVLLEAEQPWWVRHHNIVGVMSEESILGRWSPEGDGVVEYESAHLDDVASEVVVDADHVSVHRHPRSVLEVRRLLLDHVVDLRVSGILPPRRPGPAGPVQGPHGRPTLPAGYQQPQSRRPRGPLGRIGSPHPVR